MIDKKLIHACKKQQREAQRQVYELLVKKLYYTCSRYLKKQEEIEEAMADAFFTIFTKIDQLKDENAFEGWAKKIAVNHCLMQLKKKVNFNLYLEDVSIQVQPLTEEMADLEEEDLLNLLNYLPEGSKTVFILFIIEGFGHKEIADQLNISVGTSKSQLNVAKTKLKELVNILYYQKAK